MQKPHQQAVNMLMADLGNHGGIVGLAADQRPQGVMRVEFGFQAGKKLIDADRRAGGARGIQRDRDGIAGERGRNRRHGA